MDRHLRRPQDTAPSMVWAAYNLRSIAENGQLPPNVRTGAAQLAQSLQGLVDRTNERRRQIENVLGEITPEYDQHDVSWIERRQRATGRPLQKLLDERFAKTAARALRKAAEREPNGQGYVAAARAAAFGECHYLDLISDLDAAHVELKMTPVRRLAIEISERRLRALWSYCEAADTND